MSDQEADYRAMTVEIVAAYVGSKNHLRATELASLIGSIHSALSGLASQAPVEPEKPQPAVRLNKAVQRDRITCLFDGQGFKSIRRHLSVAHGMTPQEYRASWGLPADSLMVAPGYSEARSGFAKAIGFGRRGSTAPELQDRAAAPVSPETPQPQPLTPPLP